MPFIYDEKLKKEVEIKKLPANVIEGVVVKVTKDLNLDKLVYSTVPFTERIILVNMGGHIFKCINKEIFEENDINIVFSNKTGCYRPAKVQTADDIIPGNGGYPYPINRLYNIEKNLDLFTIPEPTKDSKSKLDYTFGIEYETAAGYIPSDKCFANKLVPLRDGSIQGIEYTTGIMHMDSDANTIKKQAALLKQYTLFNKDCSMHIHFGGFPLTPTYLWILYCVCKKQEETIEYMLPKLSFRTEQYKTSRKNYCQRLPVFNNFKEMYYQLSDQKTEFMENLMQAHPSDPNKEGKWNIHSRYCWVNFVNALFFSNSKTIEFRILRPMYSSEMITNFIYYFGGLMKYAEHIYKNGGFSSINHNKLDYKLVINYINKYRYEEFCNAYFGKEFNNEIMKIASHNDYLKNTLLDNIGENYDLYKLFNMFNYNDMVTQCAPKKFSYDLVKFELPKPKEKNKPVDMGKFDYRVTSAKEILDNPDLFNEFVEALEQMMNEDN